MKKHVSLIILTLFLVSYYSFQKSQLLYYTYQANGLSREVKELENLEKILRMEIYEEASPNKLYDIWKSKYPQLVFNTDRNNRSIMRGFRQ